MIINLSARALSEAGVDLRFLHTEDPQRLKESENNSWLLAQLFKKEDRSAPVTVVSALESLLEHYTFMVNSGDCGNWDPEKEEVVIAARAALKGIQ